MSAEDILKTVLLEVGLDNESAQLTSNDYEIRQIKQFMNEAGDDISRRTEWPSLNKIMNVAGGQGEVALPSDFFELSETGAVRLNKVGFHPVIKTTDPETWEFISARPSSQPYYHLSSGKIMFVPDLDADGAKVRYVSKNWVEDRGAIEQNGDNLHIPERLVAKGAIWRWKRQKGLPFDDNIAEYEADIITEIKAAKGEA